MLAARSGDAPSGGPPRRALDAVLENEDIMFTIAGMEGFNLWGGFQEAVYYSSYFPSRCDKNQMRALSPVSKGFRRGLAWPSLSSSGTALHDFWRPKLTRIWIS